MHVYSEQIAYHYATYRPPLHQLILDEALSNRQFTTGLDIGCGTGYSAIALLSHCQQVQAVDNSQPMLDRAVQDPCITYHLGRAEELPVADRSVDVVTFAGVLSYLNAPTVTAELKRVSRPKSLIIPYDFEIIFDDLQRLLTLPDANQNDTYDHACNLSDQPGVSTLKQTSRQVELPVSGHQAAHALLSDESRYNLLAEKYDTAKPFDHIARELEDARWSGTLHAKTYLSVHQLNI